MANDSCALRTAEAVGSLIIVPACIGHMIGGNIGALLGPLVMPALLYFKKTTA
jgi:hypothetical protein